MEFSYRGGEDCNPAVKERFIRIDTSRRSGDATILVGRNGSGKTLAATLIGVTRDFVFAQTESEHAKAKDAWMDLVSDLGLETLDFLLEDLQILRSSLSDGRTNLDLPAFFEDVENEGNMVCDVFLEPEFVRSTSNEGWDTDHSVTELLATVRFKFSELDSDNPGLAVSFIPRVRHHQEVTFYAENEEDEEEVFFADDKSGDRILIAQKELSNICPEGIMRVILEGMENQSQQLLDGFAKTHASVCIPAFGRLKEETGVSPEEIDMAGAYGWDMGATFGNEVLVLLMERAYPSVKFLSVDRTWSKEQQAKIDVPLLEYLVERYSVLREQFGYDEDAAEARIGHEMPTRAELEFGTFHPIKERNASTLLPLPFYIVRHDVKPYSWVGLAKDFLDAYDGIKKPGLEDINFLGHVHDVADSISSTLAKIDSVRSFFHNARIIGIEQGRWSVLDGDLDAFLQEYLRFAVSIRICRAEARPTLALFEMYRGLIAQRKSGAEIETLLRVVGPHAVEHAPSGYRRLLTMVIDIIGENSDQDPYILFIDEPEISLHIDWQTELINLLQNLRDSLGPRTSGLLLATHSPDLIQDHLDKITDLTLAEEA